MAKTYLTEERFNKFLVDDFAPLKGDVKYIAAEMKTLQVNLQTINGAARHITIDLNPRTDWFGFHRRI